MKNNIKFFSILICIGVLSLYYFSNPENSTQKHPTPAEYIQKKKDRKIYKQHRKDYFKKMHKAEDDINWRAINQNRLRFTSKPPRSPTMTKFIGRGNPQPFLHLLREEGESANELSTIGLIKTSKPLI